MKPSFSSRSFWRAPAAAVAALALSGAAVMALAQSSYTPPQGSTQGAAPLTLLLRGPTGDPSTLVFSADAGWRLHRGWASVAKTTRGDGMLQMMKTAMKSPPVPPEEQPATARPLTVFIDGPTGYTFMYNFDQGWKFVGQIANDGR
ncbi:hypothetical protein WKW79_03740 [Variovorax robiniae]|uniref:Copper resistance protein CopC n=1 Tax=Variovorax robiniae TaxID=1836199 RepID=A0ABU8X1I4_9BURK